MNPFPLQALQTDVAVQWAIYGRGMANSLNPLDHPWNFDSATVAKHRLRAITRSDRSSCNDGKWVARRREPGFWDIQIVDGEIYLRGKRIESAVEVERYFKPRYRWEVRR